MKAIVYKRSTVHVPDTLRMMHRNIPFEPANGTDYMPCSNVGSYKVLDGDIMMAIDIFMVDNDIADVEISLADRRIGGTRRSTERCTIPMLNDVLRQCARTLEFWRRESGTL